MDISLPEWPWEMVLQVAKECRARVWAVGGAVRDALLGADVHDWDFAVQGDSLALARAVADRLDAAFFPLDVERDTGRVITESPEGRRIELDFAGLRGDSLEADLKARDFTINALALDEGGALLDATTGLADLESGTIRATTAAAFRDDPVRLLRGVRFEAKLGFGIEPATTALMERDAPLLGGAAPERVRDELVRLLAATPVVSGLERLNGLGLLKHVLPELEDLKGVGQSPPHRFDVYRHSLLVVDALERALAAIFGRETRPGAPDGAAAHVWRIIARALGQFAPDLSAHLSVQLKGGRDRALLLTIGVLLHDVGKSRTYAYDETGKVHFPDHALVGAEMSAARMEKLRFSRDEVARVQRIVHHHPLPLRLEKAGKLTRRSVHRYYRATGDAGVGLALGSLADLVATLGPDLKKKLLSRRLETVETLLVHFFERHEETIAPPPLVTGDELMDELGIEGSPEVGRLLEEILEAQAAGDIKKRNEALALARRLHEQRQESRESRQGPLS
ncbi:MAG: HD domain-containing protein [Anaerolineales bacterium]|nr:MAG: HD domain-containing protein [Anaerolineales bacterium]